jgi:ergothioneine biosynthesis protein EgtB
MSSSQDLINNYQRVREQTQLLCKPLEIEDHVIQSMDDVSPPKWHLAHTTWFFEIFILIPHCATYRPFPSDFIERFNSYYQQLGHPFLRGKRGLLSRPTLKNIIEYRDYVDTHMVELIKTLNPELLDLIMLGLNHEQQHQELILMDIKHNFSIDPTLPPYMTNNNSTSLSIGPLTFLEADGGLINIGSAKNEFCFDNELPRHQHFLLPYKIANRLITNGEFLAFIESGGYQDPKFWLHDGWQAIQNNHWHAPLYWIREENDWQLFTLSGLQKLNVNEPVSHISYYEADAFAKWHGSRLPTEFEWEHYVSHHESIEGNFLESQHYHPQTQDLSHQFYGDVWEWTASPYAPYPRYQSLEGAIGEYNGKFMCNQFVLKGGSFGTPMSHIRPTYRNFYAPDKRWQFSGLRLAQSS